MASGWVRRSHQGFTGPPELAEPPGSAGLSGSAGPPGPLDLRGPLKAKGPPEPLGLVEPWVCWTPRSTEPPGFDIYDPQERLGLFELLTLDLLDP